MSQTDERQQLHSLTSLRFFFAALIVIHHAIGLTSLQIPLALTQGVSYFFVLSGFILAYAWPKIETIASAKKFIFMRFFRLWPLHIVTLLGSLALVEFDRAMVVRNPTYLLFHGTMLQSWIPIRESALGLNWPAWSISTELFFYLLFPLLLLMKRTIHWLLFGVGMVVFFAFLHTIGCPQSPDELTGVSCQGLTYSFPVSRLPEFVLGIVAARTFSALRHRQAGRGLSISAWTTLELGAVLLIVATLLRNDFVVSPLIALAEPAIADYWLRTIAAAPAAFVVFLVFAMQGGLLSRLLSSRGLIWLGDISFSLYLVHTIPVRFFNEHRMLIEWMTDWGRVGLIFAISLPVSAALYHIVEVPCRDAARRYIARSGATSRAVTVP